MSQLRKLRQERGLTIMGLAHKVGSSPAWLHYIEKYDHVPQPELRLRIADALGRAEDELWPAPGPIREGETTNDE